MVTEIVSIGSKGERLWYETGDTVRSSWARLGSSCDRSMCDGEAWTIKAIPMVEEDLKSDNEGGVWQWVVLCIYVTR